MLIHRLCGAVRVWAPAKINLFLEVLGRRADGYHELATLMMTVGLFDTVEVRENAGGDIRLACDHPTLSTGPDNLVCRAVDLVRRRFAGANGNRRAVAQAHPSAGRSCRGVVGRRRNPGRSRPPLAAGAGRKRTGPSRRGARQRRVVLLLRSRRLVYGTRRDRRAAASGQAARSGPGLPACGIIDRGRLSALRCRRSRWTERRFAWPSRPGT